MDRRGIYFTLCCCSLRCLFSFLRLFRGRRIGRCGVTIPAEKGELLWKFRVVPSACKLTGNQRLISVWPVRGGSVVHQGHIYLWAATASPSANNPAELSNQFGRKSAAREEQIRQILETLEASGSYLDELREQGWRKF